MPSLTSKTQQKQSPSPAHDSDSSTPTHCDPHSLTLESLAVLHRFLSYADPDAADLLPLEQYNDPQSSSHPAREIPISQWNVLYTTTQPASKNAQSTSSAPFTSSITVRSHPDPNRHLFSVQSTIPGVSARQFWSLMASAENRRLWDSTVEEGSVKRWLADELSSEPDPDPHIRALASDMAARVELLRFGSIFMVAKPRDMVLLSVDARLPSNPGSPTSPLRLVSTSQSVPDPSIPPRKGYTRFDLQVGGFMVEDLRDDGLAPESDSTQPNKRVKGPQGRGKAVRSTASDPATSEPQGTAVLVTQVSDLGEMAAWVPSSVIRMVASTLVPRSIASIAKVAKTMHVHRVLRQADADDANDTQQQARCISWSVKEKLAGAGGEWYLNRTLPTMVGTGQLRRPSSPTPKSELKTEPETELPPMIAIQEASAVDDHEAQASPASQVPNSQIATESNHVQPKRLSLHHQQLSQASLQDQQSPATRSRMLPRSPGPLPRSPGPGPDPALVATPPPRKTSLPPTPSSPYQGLNQLRAAASPDRERPPLSINLNGLTPPSFGRLGLTAMTPSSTGGPISPGMYSDSDAGIDDMVSTSSSTSTPGHFAVGRFRRRFDLPMSFSPSDGGTETVPGSVAGSEFEEPGSGDYLSKGRGFREPSSQTALYGLTSSNFRRATLHLAKEGEEQDNVSASGLADAGAGSVAGAGAGLGADIQEEVEEVDTGDTTIGLDQPLLGLEDDPICAFGLHRAVPTPRQKAADQSAAKSLSPSRLPFSPPKAPGGSMRILSTSSPSETRSRMLASQRWRQHSRTVSSQEGASELDRRLRRISRALIAEVERRQQQQQQNYHHQASSSGSASASGTGSSASGPGSTLLSSSASGSGAGSAFRSAVGVVSPKTKYGAVQTRLEPRNDILDMLAEALSESLPNPEGLVDATNMTRIAHEGSGEETISAATAAAAAAAAKREGDGRGGKNAAKRRDGRLMEQAEAVSALLLSGSDALALALAPGARESLALGFSTPSESGSQSPSVESFPSARFPSGRRKVSVHSLSRSISVSSTTASALVVTEPAAAVVEPAPPASSGAVDHLKQQMRPRSGMLAGLISLAWHAQPHPQPRAKGSASVSVSSPPRIPAKGSVGRLRSRQNYRLDLNSKLHPFPASLRHANAKMLPPLRPQRSYLYNEDEEDGVWVDEEV